jgi:hypothetical protein
MIYSNFSGIINTLQKQSDLVSDLYHKNVDLLNFVNPYESINGTKIVINFIC